MAFNRVFMDIFCNLIKFLFNLTEKLKELRDTYDFFSSLLQGDANHI